jgi:hypothetical protein
MENPSEPQRQKSADLIWTDVRIDDLAAFFLNALIALIPVSLVILGAAFALMVLIRSIGH